MRLSKLTEETLKDILLLYDQIIGGQVKNYVFSLASPPISERLQYLRERLNSSNAVDWRFGSKLKTKDGREDVDAKLIVWNKERTKDKDTIISFSFDPNLMHGKEAEQLKKDFEKAIDDFLVTKDLAVKLKIRGD